MTAPDQVGEQSFLSEEERSFIDESHAEYSDLLLDSAKWIDSFFDDDRYVSEINQTRVTVKLSAGYSRKDSFEIKPRFDLRLRLPRLEKHVNLIISSGEDLDFDREGKTAVPDDKYRREDFSAAIRFFGLDKDDVNFSWDGGLSWDYLFGGARLRLLHQFDDWLGRLTERARYYSDSGWENILALDLETDITEDLLFRSTSSMTSYQEKDGLYYGENFRFYYVFDEYSAVSFDTGITFHTEPVHKMSDLSLKVRYRRQFLRDWLVLEVSPRLNFPEDYDYEANPGLVVQLEAIFGYSSHRGTNRKNSR